MPTALRPTQPPMRLSHQVSAFPIARDTALVESGLDVAIARGATRGVSYTGQLAEDAQDHSFKAALAVKF